MNAPMRGIERILGSVEAPVGTFTVRRVLPTPNQPSVGPWVFLDHFGPFRVKPGHDGVGPHPHAGIETVTYLLQGRNQHRDSAGHVGVVGPGGAQWMTAGRGIIHAEAPIAELDADLTMEGIQLWTTLPRAKKMMLPGYQRIAADEIVECEKEGARVRLVAGEITFSETSMAGPAKVQMPLILAWLQLAPGASARLTPESSFEMALYGVRNPFAVAGEQVREGQLAVLGTGDGIKVHNPGAETSELMMLGGAPAEGPLVFHGPFVMNSREQIRAAEHAWATGQMGQLKAAQIELTGRNRNGTHCCIFRQ